MTREFQMQSHLLICSGELTLRDRFGEESAREMTVATSVGAGWVATERLSATLGIDSTAEGLLQLLSLHPMVPPGFRRTTEYRADRIRLTLTPDVRSLLDPQHPGVPGLLARGEPRGVEAMVHPLCPRAAVQVAAGDGQVVVEVALEGADEAAKLPDAAALTKIGIAASWTFDTSE